MSAEPLSCVLISDFNIENLGVLLDNDAGAPGVRSTVAPFGQVVQVLMDELHEVWASPRDFAVVWTSPESVLPSLSRAMMVEAVDTEALLAEVDDYVARLAALSGRAAFVLVPTWVLPPHQRGFGLLSSKRDVGLGRLLLEINLRLMQRCDAHPHLHVIDASRWVAMAGARSVNPKLFYMAKIGFAPPVFKEAVKDIKSAAATLRGQAIKLIVVDLDNTMWGGIVGDDGVENLRLGGHDPIGEAFVDFQRVLAAASNAGVLLAVCSKNEEDVALHAIRSHPEMVLREKDFVAHRINWQDKANNIAEMVAELNLGLQSVMFIDDSAIERARVKEALPEVHVPEWPKDPFMYASTLRSMRYLESAGLSAEDKKRLDMYKSEAQRQTLKKDVGSIDDWIQTLDLKVVVEPLDERNLPRATQLLNKTNQLNLRTRRLGEAELKDWADAPHNGLWTFRVTDKFGDYGLTGIVSITVDGDRAIVADYLLSCRVMGRNIEKTMLHVAAHQAAARGARVLTATYSPTKKNAPCLKFFERSGMQVDDTTMTFTWPTTKPYALPPGIELVVS